MKYDQVALRIKGYSGNVCCQSLDTTRHICLPFTFKGGLYFFPHLLWNAHTIIGCSMPNLDCILLACRSKHHSAMPNSHVSNFSYSRVKKALSYGVLLCYDYFHKDKCRNTPTCMTEYSRMPTMPLAYLHIMQYTELQMIGFQSTVCNSSSVFISMRFSPVWDIFKERWPSGVHSARIMPLGDRIMFVLLSWSYFRVNMWRNGTFILEYECGMVQCSPFWRRHHVATSLSMCPPSFLCYCFFLCNTLTSFRCSI